MKVATGTLQPPPATETGEKEEEEGDAAAIGEVEHTEMSFIIYDEAWLVCAVGVLCKNLV